MEDYKEKYEMALEGIQEILSSGQDSIKMPQLQLRLQGIFPELRGDEDEKIRKALVRFHKSTIDIDGIKGADILAWLEKQGNIDKTSYDIAEKEKYDFVSCRFIKCRKSFDEFKEDTSYWLEYVGNDNYIGRSDNILNQKFHITPRQLYCLFTQEHCPKEDNANAPIEYGKYVDECLNDASEHFFSEGEDKYSVADLFYAGVRCGKSWFEKQGTSTKLSEEEQNSFAKGVLSNCALSFINYLDAHSYEGKMCVSNGECEDIENAFHNAMWDRLHRYYCKYIEKQGEQKPILDFKASNWYVSKVDGKIHDMTYNSTDKVEPIFSIGDVLCDKSCTTLNKKYQPIIEILDIRNGMYICNNCSFPISQQDEYELVTRKNEQQYAWSDEDEKRIDCICDFVWKNRKGDTDEIYQQEQDVKWLKLLKDRAIWKPSREQMEIFKELIDDNTERFFYPTLKSLYNDLKKLKEE